MIVHAKRQKVKRWGYPRSLQLRSRIRYRSEKKNSMMDIRWLHSCAIPRYMIPGYNNVLLIPRSAGLSHHIYCMESAHLLRHEVPPETIQAQQSRGGGASVQYGGCCPRLTNWAPRHRDKDSTLHRLDQRNGLVHRLGPTLDTP